MTYAITNPIVGIPSAQLSGLVVDTIPRFPPGQLFLMADPWWGFGEFMYARAAAAIPAFNLVTMLPVFDTLLQSYRYDCVPAANLSNSGRSLAVAAKTMAVGDYGWFQVSGLVPVSCAASVAADSSFGIAAVGQGGAVAAGKQILNARITAAATTTVAKVGATALPGSAILTVSNTDGWFVGAYLSGTGVPAGAFVSAIDPSGRFVTMSALSTAGVFGATVTATYNNATIFYNVAQLSRAFIQGAIT